MQPDLAIEECELERLRERTLASLPRMCRCVYTMVRDQDLSYQTVAAVLGISRSAVCHHVTMAQRRFRIALLEQGVGAPIRRTTCRPEPVACRPDQSEQPARAAA